MTELEKAICKARAHAFEDAIGALKNSFDRIDLERELLKLRALEYQKLRDAEEK